MSSNPRLVVVAGSVSRGTVVHPPPASSPASASVPERGGSVGPRRAFGGTPRGGVRAARELWYQAGVRTASRLWRYFRRFLLEPAYRNRVFDLLDEHLGRGRAATVAAAGSGPRTWARGGWARGKSIYLVGGCELSYVTEYLVSQGMEALLSFDLQTAGDPYAELHQPRSPLFARSFDFVVFSQYQPLSDLVLLAQRGDDGATDLVEEGLGRLRDQLRAALGALRERTPAPVVVAGYPLRYRPWRGRLESRRDGALPLREVELRFELLTREVAAEFADVAVLEPALVFAGEPLDALLGSYDADGVNDHLTRRGAALLGERLIDTLALYVAALPRFKAVAFDLDDTLWGGTLVEDGRRRRGPPVSASSTASASAASRPCGRTTTCGDGRRRRSVASPDMPGADRRSPSDCCGRSGRPATAGWRAWSPRSPAAGWRGWGDWLAVWGALPNGETVVAWG